MTIPMGKLTTAINKEVTDFQYLSDILRKFVTVIQGRNSAGKIMNKAIQLAADAHNMEFANIVCSCLPVELSFGVQVTLSKLKINDLFNNKALRESAVFKHLMSFLAHCEQVDRCSGLLLFRVEHNGIYVAHNIEMTRISTPRIVLPASSREMLNIQIMPLETWALDYQVMETETN